MIGVELRNPRRLEDEDVATEGSAPHSYWLRYGPTVVLTTGEQMRFASEDELVAAHTVPHYAVANLQLRGAKSFVDARPFGLPPQQPPEQEQQQDGQGVEPSSPSAPAQPSGGAHQQAPLLARCRSTSDFHPPVYWALDYPSLLWGILIGLLLGPVLETLVLLRQLWALQIRARFRAQGVARSNYRVLE